MSYVYILYSAEADRFYTGYTRDLAVRVAAHQAGEGRWTRGRGPWVLR